MATKKKVLVYGLLAIISLSCASLIWSAVFGPSGKSYPNNHVYQALLKANDKRLVAYNGKAPSKKFNSRDVAAEFIDATKEEVFTQIIADFNELGGGHKPGNSPTNIPAKPYSLDPKDYVSGKTYYFGLGYNQISKLFIPDSTFTWWYAAPRDRHFFGSD